MGLYDTTIMSIATELPYSTPTVMLYTIMTKFPVAQNPRNFLVVESNCRGPVGWEMLPSWVIVFSNPQHSTASLKLREPDTKISSFLNFPLLDEEENGLFPGHPNERAIPLRGIYVAAVTEVYNVELPQPLHRGQETARVLKYDVNIRNPKKRTESQAPTEGESSLPGRFKPIETAEDEVFAKQNENNTLSPVSILNTSWAPWNNEVSDIIVVTIGCEILVVLRESGDGTYTFIGGVWLIDSELEFQRDEDNNGSIFSPTDNPSFSKLMYGAACEGKMLKDVEVFLVL